MSIDIAAACSSFSGWNQQQCQCVVNAESGGNSHAVHYNSVTHMPHMKQYKSSSNDGGGWNKHASLYSCLLTWLAVHRVCMCVLQGDNTYDAGAWQIDSVNWPECNGGSAPCDMAANLKCAIDTWRYGGSSFSAWATCGKCGACNSAINPEWDGSWPDLYDAARPFPEWAINSTDARAAQTLDWVRPTPKHIILKDE